VAGTDEEMRRWNAERYKVYPTLMWAEFW